MGFAAVSVGSTDLCFPLDSSSRLDKTLMGVGDGRRGAVGEKDGGPSARVQLREGPRGKGGASWEEGASLLPSRSPPSAAPRVARAVCRRIRSSEHRSRGPCEYHHSAPMET